jgi:8-oxo-dGTP diphosphatase
MQRNEPIRKYPIQPVPSVHTAVFRNNQVLVVKRANEPSKGRWSLPGGVVELGEKLWDAARRELLEESEVECNIEGLVDIVDNIIPDSEGRIQYHYLVIYLFGSYIGGIPTPGSDASDVAWITYEEFPDLDMNPGVKQVLPKAFSLKHNC